MLEFARVVKAEEKVVSGTMHHLTIEAIEAGKKNIYEAKVKNIKSFPMPKLKYF